MAQSYLFPIEGTHRLSGNFAELRKAHFHSGLDISTYGKTGFKVVAVEKGWIERIFSSYYGYGKAVYIRHPDGSKSVYAHLDRFAPKIERYLYNIQVKEKKYFHYLFLKPNELTVERGEIIGFSGNTGASSGPHLHFEIRDEEDQPVNPLPFFKKIIKDHIPPFITRVAFEPLSPQSRIEKTFERKIFIPKRSGRIYYLNQIVRLRGPVGFAFTAYDRINGASNYNGIYTYKLYLDDTLIFHFQADTFAFWEKRYLLNHIAYDFYWYHGGRLIRAYKAPNNQLRMYRYHKNRGILWLKDTKIHRLRLVVRDLHGNQAVFICKIQQGEKDTLYFSKQHLKKFSYKLFPKVLCIQGEGIPHPADGIFVQYNDGTTQFYPFQFVAKNACYVLIPLEAGHYPIQLWSNFNSDTLLLPIVGIAYPDKEQWIFIHETLKIYLPKHAVFDTCWITYRKHGIWEAIAPSIPLFKPVTLCYKVSDEALEHYVVIRKKTKGYEGIGRDAIRNGWICVRSKRFGSFRLFKDEVPPVIKPLNLEALTSLKACCDYLLFEVRDLSPIVVNSIKVFVNGRWVIAEYYEYQNLLRIPLRYLPAQPIYVLEILLEDVAGNRTYWRWEPSLVRTY